MQTVQATCPHCGSSINFAAGLKLGATVECLVCMRSFVVNATTASAPSAAPPKPKPAEAIKPAGVPKAVAAPLAPETALPQKKATATRPEPAAEGNGIFLVVTVCLLLLMTAGVGFAVWKMTRPSVVDHGDPDQKLASNSNNPKKTVEPDKKSEPDKKTEPDKNVPKTEPEKTPAESKEPKQKDKLDKTPDDGGDPKTNPEDKGGLKRKNPPKVEDKEPETGPITKIEPKQRPIAGVDQEKINLAIERGIQALKKNQNADGSWEFMYHVGYASLGGMTLLECKVPANDPVIQKAANFVRQNAANLNKCYDASMAILFLDRLGDARDKALIQTLALRLLASQSADGGWKYDLSNPLGPQEMQQLALFLQTQKKLGPGAGVRTDQLSPNLRGLQVVRNAGKTKGKHLLSESGSDNSNTQFALLAMWAARRHDVVTDQALLAAYDRFAISQSNDGGWDYIKFTPPPLVMTGSFEPPSGPLTPHGRSTNTMTCVGLLALALGHGVAPDVVGNDPKNPKQSLARPALQDPRIKKALDALALHIDHPVESGMPPKKSIDNHLYFLWSVERVAMLYELNTIGGKDWYGWGAQTLIGRQGGDGLWANTEFVAHSSTSNTCFALLFLRRSNIVQDLTVTLRLQSGIRQ